MVNHTYAPARCSLYTIILYSHHYNPVLQHFSLSSNNCCTYLQILSIPTPISGNYLLIFVPKD